MNLNLNTAENDLKLNLLNKNGLDDVTLPATVSILAATPTPKFKSKTLTNAYKYRGIAYAILSAFIISVTNILIRKCKSFSGSELALVRFVMQFSIFLPVAIYKKQNILGEKGQRLMLSIRGIFGPFGLLSVYFAITMINPSDAIALFNCGVIFVTIFARLFLNEKLTIIHIFALILTVIGVMFISQPTFLFERSHNSSLNLNETNMQNGSTPTLFDIKFLGYSLSMVGALSYTVVSIVLKKLANKKAHLSVVLLYATYYALPVSFVISIVLLVTGIDKRERTILTGSFDELKYEICLAILGGCLSVCSQILMNLAVQAEDASKVSILKSTDLLFIFLLQYVFLGIYTNFYNTLGAFFIFMAALLVMIYKMIDKKHMKRLKKRLEKKGEKIPHEEVEEKVTNIKCLNILSKIFFFKF